MACLLVAGSLDMTGRAAAQEDRHTFDFGSSYDEAAQGGDTALPGDAQTDAAVVGWDGAYVGLLGSLGRSEADLQERFRDDPDGARIGVFGGYNLQNGRVVYGLEGDAGIGGTEGRDNDRRIETGLDASLRARLGYVPLDDVLLYGAGGVTASDVEIETPGIRDSDTRLGYTLGAGVDYALNDQAFLRGEYRFNDYGGESVMTDIGPDRLDLSENRLSFGFGFRF